MIESGKFDIPSTMSNLLKISPDDFRAAENTMFELEDEIKILEAYKKGQKIEFLKYRLQIPLYRCCFIENEIVVTHLTHITEHELPILKNLLSDSYNPFIEVFVLHESSVVETTRINANSLAHILFRFHHRIAKKYLMDEYITVP